MKTLECNVSLTAYRTHYEIVFDVWVFVCLSVHFRAIHCTTDVLEIVDSYPFLAHLIHILNSFPKKIKVKIRRNSILCFLLCLTTCENDIGVIVSPNDHYQHHQQYHKTDAMFNIKMLRNVVKNVEN